MQDNNPIFDLKYDQGSATVSEPKLPLLLQNKQPPEVKIESKEYGIGKPRRIIFKAQITNDKD